LAQFSYSARDKTGGVQKGLLFAPDRAAATAAIQARGLAPILVREELVASKAGAGGSLLDKIKAGVNKVKLADKVIFTRQFATMINAGVPITQALTILEKQSESKRLQAAVTGVQKAVTGGAPLAASMAQYPDVFNNIYVNMVKAGEAGGILDQVLDRLATQLEKDSAVVSKIKGAMIYPGVVTTATVGAFFFLMTVIVPGLAGVFANVGAQLPWYTVMLLAISSFMVHSWYILIAIIVGLVVAFNRWHATPKGRRLIDKMMLKMPIFGPILVKVNVARFARTFGSLLSSGISVLDAINATGSALSSTVYQDELAEVAKRVKNGKPMSEHIKNSKNFPPIVGQMLAVGEETGQMDTILLKLADFYEAEVDTVVSGLTSIIEPILIMVLGGMVGFIVISVFGPLSNLSSSVGNGG
jgi:type IV pilus assembly protein PilC